MLCTPLGCAAADDAAKPSWEDTVESLRSPGEDPDCATVWERIWPFAEKGHGEAAELLAQIVALRHLTPPGFGEDALDRSRLVTALFEAAAVAGSGNASTALADIYSLLDGGGPGAELATCWRQVADGVSAADDCAQLNATLQFSPSLQMLGQELASLAQPGGEARCIAPEGDR